MIDTKTESVSHEINHDSDNDEVVAEYDICLSGALRN